MLPGFWGSDLWRRSLSHGAGASRRLQSACFYECKGIDWWPMQAAPARWRSGRSSSQTGRSLTSCPAFQPLWASPPLGDLPGSSRWGRTEICRVSVPVRQNGVSKGGSSATTGRIPFLGNDVIQLCICMFQIVTITLWETLHYLGNN